MSWVWVLDQTVYAIHSEQLAEHGGLEGVRDSSLVESALARPQHVAHYEVHDVADLAAAYGYGLTKNHPFYDGNKRTAFVVVELFLLLNGYTLVSDDQACIIEMLRLSSGDLSEADFAAWVRQNIRQG
jgi:death-on-curing protein